MQPDELRTLGVDWVRANCTSAGARFAFLQQFDRAQRRGCNVGFLFGKHLTNRGTAHLVHFHAGEMFIFELTATQEASHKAAANQMIGIESLPNPEIAPAPLELVEISDLVIDAQTHVDKSQPIRGRCSYSLLSAPPDLMHFPPSVSMHFPPLDSMRIHGVGPLVLQLWYELPGVGACTVRNFLAGGLARRGTLEFTFPAMVNSQKHFFQIPFRRSGKPGVPGRKDVG
jgi:hypothetical protein